MSHVTSTGVVFSPLAARFFPGRGVLPFEEITAVRRTGKRVLLTLIDGGKRSLRTRSTSEAEALDAAVAQALHVAGAELDAVVSVASLGKALALRQETQSLPAPIWELLLLAAAKLEAQDLHLRTSAEGAVSLSLRRNGLLHELGAFEAGPGRALLNRLKVMAGLQAFRRDVAQEGRVELQRDDRKLSARVTTVPGLRGEQASIRLHNAAKRRALDELGFAPETHKALSRLTSLRRGLVLISGPPASGKSTTMFALLQAIQTADPGRLRCVSLEDPVEIDLPGVAQVQVDEARGNGFASLLKVVLRQDVDVILVGEIRDPETARLAVSAGTTGHLVLATIHAGS
ncbi:MAG: Flp pilus assembly complex ATPase component TadA, partial [Deltaproteobacteria bacterium]|nr:Flp pilus assembly complex ATPase component TadA [Deltaproteobacteria bacterium]